MSRDEAFKNIQLKFASYVKRDVLDKVKCNKLDIYYIGLPVSKFPDFNRLVHLITSGDLLHTVSAQEADESLLNRYGSFNNENNH